MMKITKEDILGGFSNTSEHDMELKYIELTTKEKIYIFLDILKHFLIEFLFIGAYVLSFGVWVMFTYWLLF